MKLVNYKRGYNNIFDCSIHGTIKMTRTEYDKVVGFLYKTAENKPDKLWNERILYEDLARRINFKGGFLVNVRTTATELISKKWRLKNYKRGNYQLLVNNR